MRSRTYLALALASALALLPALPVASGSASGGSTGTIQTIYAPTGTTPEEIAVAGSAGSALYAITGQTTYRLAGAGLGANAPAVGAADLAVGEQVDVTATSVQTAGVTDAASIALAARLTLGEITAVTAASGQPTTFDLLANGQAFSFVEAADATVAPAGTALGTNQGAVVYSLAEGASPAAPETAFVVDRTGALPTFSGTIASANGAALALSTASGPLDFAYTSTTPVAVGQTAAGDAYLVPGAQASVVYGVNEGGAAASAISLQASTIDGTITAVRQDRAAVDLTLSGASGGATVAVLPTTDLGGASLSQLVPQASVRATGVLVGSVLTAVSLTLAQGRASGTVTSVSPAAALVVGTPGGAMTFALSASTAVEVGTYAATVVYLVPGEQVTVAYQTRASNSTPVNTATGVTIAPERLSGTVGAAPTPTSFSVTTQGGAVSVSVAPDATVAGTIAQSATVSLAGVALSGTAFEAFSVAVQAAGPPPSRVRATAVGRIRAASAQRLILAGRDGQTYTLSVNASTKVRLGRAAADASLLAAGEWARVRVAPDATTANQADALVVYLFARTAIGTVQNAATSPTGTVLTLRGRIVGHLFPVGKDRGKGERLPAKVDGGRSVTVSVPLATPISVLGQSGATGAGFQAGEAIAAEGALADQGLIARQVWILPASSQASHGKAGKGRNGAKGGNRPGRGRGSGHGKRAKHGKEGKGAQGEHPARRSHRGR